MRAGSRQQPAPGRLAIGTRLGKYEILRFIAEGGMGELYVARARGIEGFEKTVALKRILSRFAAREDHIRMFLDEAKLAATLHHPNIVQVFDIGKENGNLFFSMEYVHGTDVRTLLEAARAARRSVPLEAALEIALGVAAGLHHAHHAGIVHRDVSPSNVLLAHDGGVKLTDFGVAKAAEQTSETRPGMLKGKISYMSPEQCRDEPVDRRSDVFAIGILLYELTTLEKPFPGASDFAIMEHIVHRDVESPSVRHPGYAVELEAIVMRALRRDRDQRYPTAQELQRDLLQFTRNSKLDNSSLALESFLRDLFGDQVNVWREAEVQSSLPVAPTAVTVREKPERVATIPVVRRRRRWPLVVAIVAVAVTALAIGQSVYQPTEETPAEAATPAAPSTTPTASTTANSPPAAAVSSPSPPVPGTSAPNDEPAPTKAPAIAPPRSPIRRAPPVTGSAHVTTEAPPPPQRAVSEPPVPANESSPVAPRESAVSPDAPPPREREVPWDPDSPTFPQSR